MKSPTVSNAVKAIGAAFGNQLGFGQRLGDDASCCRHICETNVRDQGQISVCRVHRHLVPSNTFAAVLASLAAVEACPRALSFEMICLGCSAG